MIDARMTNPTSQQTEATALAGKTPRGAPVANANACRLGLRSSGLPKPFTGVAKSCRKYLKILEREIREHLGLPTGAELPRMETELCNAAYRHERTARICERLLSLGEDLKGDILSADQFEKLASKAARASVERVRIIKALGLDPRAVDDWAAVHTVAITEGNSNGE